jgi:hypothetical protein
MPESFNIVPIARLAQVQMYASIRTQNLRNLMHSMVSDVDVAVKSPCTMVVDEHDPCV